MGDVHGHAINQGDNSTLTIYATDPEVMRRLDELTQMVHDFTTQIGGSGQMPQSGQGDQDQGGQVNVTSFNQQGGVTAGTYINQAVPPSLQGHLIAANQPSESGFLTHYELSVNPMGYGGALQVRVQGGGVTSARLRNRTGMMVNVTEGSGGPGVAFAGLGNPQGPLDLFVFTSEEIDPSALEIIGLFQ